MQPVGKTHTGVSDWELCLCQCALIWMCFCAAASVLLSEGLSLPAKHTCPCLHVQHAYMVDVCEQCCFVVVWVMQPLHACPAYVLLYSCLTISSKPLSALGIVYCNTKECYVDHSGTMRWSAYSVNSGSSTAAKNFPSTSHARKVVQLSWGTTFPTMSMMRPLGHTRHVWSTKRSQNVQLPTLQHSGFALASQQCKNVHISTLLTQETVSKNVLHGGSRSAKMPCCFNVCSDHELPSKLAW